jgi:hypothetical protein
MTEATDGPDPNAGLSSLPDEASVIPRRRSVPDPLFDEFWSLYPRKVGKGTAQQAWQRARRKKADPRQIIQAAQAFAAQCAAEKTDRRYIPHPSKWLSGERWGDEPHQEVALAAPVSAPRPTPATCLNDEQLLAAVIRLAGDQARPVTSAGEIVRIVRENSAAITWNGFPVILAERAAELAAMPYPDYLQTPEWQERRKVMLKLAGYRCRVCNADKLLHVHHRTYERRGNEQPGDLIVLCDGCHKLFHDNRKLAAA